MLDSIIDYTKNVKFAKVITTTVGKLETILWQTGIINDYFRSRGGKVKGAIFGLPGAGAQCERHVNEYKGYGFAEKRINFVEIDPIVHEGQRAWADFRQFLGKTHLGCGFKIIRQALKTRKVSVVDWDDTRALLCDHVKLIRTCADAGVDVIILVLTTRGKLTPRLKIEKKRFKRRKRWTAANGGRYSEPVNELTVQAVERLARLAGYNCHNKPYFGRQPMISFVLTRKFN